MGQDCSYGKGQVLHLINAEKWSAGQNNPPHYDADLNVIILLYLTIQINLPIFAMKAFPYFMATL